MDHKSQTGDKHRGQVILRRPSPYINLPQLTPPPLPPLALSRSARPLPPPPSSPRPYLHLCPISPSSIPASSCQFQISAEAAARRLDASRRHGNPPIPPSATPLLHHPLRPRLQCDFVCWQRLRRLPRFMLYSVQIHARRSIVCQRRLSVRLAAAAAGGGPI